MSSISQDPGRFDHDDHDAPFRPSDDDAAWWAAELARMDAEDEEWLETYRGATGAIEEALSHDDGRVTDEDVARSGPCG